VGEGGGGGRASWKNGRETRSARALKNGTDIRKENSRAYRKQLKPVEGGRAGRHPKTGLLLEHGRSRERKIVENSVFGGGPGLFGGGGKPRVTDEGLVSRGKNRCRGDGYVRVKAQVAMTIVAALGSALLNY